MKEIFVLFAIYTVWALATEAVFTGFADLIRNRRAGKIFNRELPCRTSLWSILVYGVSATLAFTLIGVFAPGFFHWSWWWRGLVYMLGTYCFEFSWGEALKRLTGACPWQYRDSHWRIWKYINPEYCGLWFMFGFSLEWIKLDILPRMLS